MELNGMERSRHSRRQSLTAILPEDVHEGESSVFSWIWGRFSKKPRFPGPQTENGGKAGNEACLVSMATRAINLGTGTELGTLSSCREHHCQINRVEPKGLQRKSSAHGRSPW